MIPCGAAGSRPLRSNRPTIKQKGKKTMYITPETIATIEKLDNGKFKLSIYDNKRTVFSGLYSSFRGAVIARTKRLNNYYGRRF